MLTKSKEIKQHQDRYDTINVYKNVKEMTDRQMQKAIKTFVRNNNSKIILEIEDKLVRWKEYIQGLFDYDSPCFPLFMGN